MTEKQNWLERPILPALPGITNEVVIFAAIILMAIITRFFDLGTRVMSHDESLHTYFSWLFYRGQGYQHSPMMHGPLQFHLLALSYFLFGVSDFTARIPAVLFSIATVWMVWYWRRYLGKTGAIIAGFLMVISPYMLFYGRYVRNEAYAGFSGILMLYAILRYLENGNKRYLYLVALTLVIHFTAKETAFIYAAQALFFLTIYFIAQVTRNPWYGNERQFRTFIILLAVSILLVGGALGYGLYERSGGTLTGAETAMPADPTMPQSPLAMVETGISVTNILVLIGVVLLIGALVSLIRGYGWNRLRAERSFGLMILIGTLVLPMLAPFPLKFLEGWLHVTIPTTAPEIDSLLASQNLLFGLPREFAIMGIFIVIMFALSIAIGQLWSRDWWKPALLFWGIFTVLYTSVFTNSDGFFTGLVGSLGYWLAQQGVERGSQPWYYYVLIQIPVYEFLPAMGTLLAAYLGIKKLTASTRAEQAEFDIAEPEATGEELDELASFPASEPATAMDFESDSESDPVERNFANTFGLLLWWIVTGIIALSYAGERMPWLTYHMTWPMVLLTGWGIGQVIESISWDRLRPSRSALSLIVTILFLIGMFNSISSLLGPTPPFQGKDLSQLQATTAFLFPAILTLASAAGLVYLLRDESAGLTKVALTFLFIMGLVGTTYLAISIPTGIEAQASEIVTSVIRLIIVLAITIASLVGLFLLRDREGGAFPGLVTLTIFGFLTILTIRASFRASYINYDSAKEYLVYAHGATGIKQVMAQAKEISERTTGGMGLALSYDASAPDTGVSWPFVWYLRDYTNQRSFDQPTKALRDSVFVIVDAKNFDKVEPALGPGYYRFDYIRMWWPNQDYFGLNKDRIVEAIRNTRIRDGIWDIWFNRDYTQYAAATGHTDLTPSTWQPADQMRLYIRKDIAAQIWNYGATPVETVDVVDPTDGKNIILPADLIIDETQSPSISLNAPRSLAFAPDGTFYVADSRNHRIVHLDANGNLLGTWGRVSPDCPYVSGPPANPSLDTFCEPWGVAVGPDGSVYVSDTWNYRVMKFTPDGKLITSWSQYGSADQLATFYGPRGLAVDADGNVYVADTGNKRIVVFDADGNYLTEFGTAGLDPGQFDEPVGIAIDKNGTVYVTDTWNQRVQTFTPSDDKTVFFPDRQWEVFGWYGQSLDNKPFIAVNDEGHVFVTDPEQYRVIEFTSDGEVVRTWGDFGDSPTTFGLASGIAVDAEGHIWVTDSVYNRIMRFTLPSQ